MSSRASGTRIEGGTCLRFLRTKGLALTPYQRVAVCAGRQLAAPEKLGISDGATSTAAKEDLKKAGVAEAVNKCGDACDEFAKVDEEF